MGEEEKKEKKDPHEGLTLVFMQRVESKKSYQCAEKVSHVDISLEM